MIEEDFDWDFLCNSIRKEKTVLFLGAGIYINDDGKLGEADFLNKFYQQNSGKLLSYHKNEQLFSFENDDAKILLNSKIRELYDTDNQNEILSKIAEIPFHLIINVSPDNHLAKIFEKKKFSYANKFYDKRIETQVEPEVPTKSTPLIYNLLGTCEEEGSMIISHDDLYEYLIALATKKLPLNVRRYFTNERSNNVLFLGLNYQKWYFPYILNLLELNKQKVVRFATESQLDNETKVLCENQLKINFVGRDVLKFTDELFKKFSGELRVPMTSKNARLKYNSENIYSYIHSAFGANELDTLCLSYFPEVKNNFTPSQSKDVRVNMLVEYCQLNGLLEMLIDKAKDANPVQFKNYQPYFR